MHKQHWQIIVLGLRMHTVSMPCGRTDDVTRIGQPLTGHDNAEHYWPRHAEPGSLGFELLDGLPNVLDYDFFVWKGIELDLHPYGACYHDVAEQRSTGVIEFLKQRQVTHVIVGGLALEFCVFSYVAAIMCC